MALLEPRIDHVVVNVGNALDEAAERYERLGFRLTPRGHHTLGTSNNLAIFGTDYLELLGYEKGRENTRVDLVQTPPGLSGLVFKPPADEGFAAALNAAGVAADEARSFSRPVEGPDASGDARFRTVNLRDAVPNGRVFFCHHHTPELVWQLGWQQHPNGVTGIAAFAIAAAAPERIAEPFRRMFGAERVRADGDGVAFTTLEGAVVRIATPDALARRYGATLPAVEGEARMVALELRTESAAAARAALEAGGIEGVTEAAGALVVPAGAACGVAMVFRG